MTVASSSRKRSEYRPSAIGAIFWIGSFQYFAAQIVAALDWSKPYSVAYNTISDLGNTACAPYRGGYVCSPLHGWMNASFIVLGVSMIVGSILLGRSFYKNRLSTLGFSFMGIAGLGTALVGLFPENTISQLHVLGATLPFLIGNLALIILGLTVAMPRALRFYTVISGLVALSALGLFVSHTYLGLGIGGMERITAYPQTIWLIVFGIYALSKRFQARR